MRNIAPTPRDGNGHFLTGFGSGMFTKRFAALDTNPNEIFLECDMKSCLIHQEGTTDAISITGGISGSTAAMITSNGVTLAEVKMAIPGSISAFSDSLGTAIDLGSYTIRQILTPSLGGNWIRITVEAQSGQAAACDNVAIVEQDSGANGIGVPVEIKFQGSSGFSLTAGSSITSDELYFPVSTEKTYLIIFDDAGSGQVNHIVTGGSGYYKKAASDSYNVAALSGATLVEDATAFITNLGVSMDPSTICKVAAPADTIDVSVIAWR